MTCGFGPSGVEDSDATTTSREPWAVAYGYGMTGMDGSVNRGERDRLDVEEVQGLVYSQQKPKNFQDSSSHRIFRRMHGVLIIDKNKN